jgi:uncharacterized membrane protein YdjX (TVP38/TMEM64 family)
MAGKRRYYWLRGLILLGSLAAIAFLLKSLGFEHLFEKEWIESHVKGQGLKGEVVFLAAGALITAVGLPRQVVAFFGGYAFGLLLGTLLGTLAALAGCTLAFYYARVLGRSLVIRLFEERIKRFNNFIEGHPFSMTLLVRLLPVGNNLATNLAAGVSRIHAGNFFAATFLGYIPQSLVAALIGSGVTQNPVLKIGSGIVLFVLSGFLGMHLYRRYRHGKTYDAALEAQD